MTQPGVLKESNAAVRKIINDSDWCYDDDDNTQWTQLQILGLNTPGIRWFTRPNRSHIEITGGFCEMFTCNGGGLLENYHDEIQIIVDEANAALENSVPLANQGVDFNVRFQAQMLGGRGIPSVRFAIVGELHHKHTEFLIPVMKSIRSIMLMVIKCRGQQIVRAYDENLRNLAKCAG